MYVHADVSLGISVRASARKYVSVAYLYACSRPCCRKHGYVCTSASMRARVLVWYVSVRVPVC